MNIHTTKLIYFSPTQTTKKVLESIAQGVHTAAVEHIDLTSARCEIYEQAGIHDTLAIIGSPVYGGRLPVDTISRLQQFKGNGTSADNVVVYGNRAYEDALLELRDLSMEMGCKPFAAGAFIGEHSYSTNAAPIAAGRPDTADLCKAEEFGKMVTEKIGNI